MHRTYYAMVHVGRHTFPIREPIHCEDRADLDAAAQKVVRNWRRDLGPSSYLYARAVEVSVYDYRRRFIMTVTA